MACNCTPSSDCNPCPDCAEPSAACECLPSALDNFIAHFFGTLQKTVIDGRVVWTLPCDLAVGLEDNPRLPGEGLACYFLRLFGEGIVGLKGDKGDKGDTGDVGASNYATLTAGFVVPADDCPTVSVLVTSGSLFGAGGIVYIPGAGWFEVAAVSGNTVFLTCIVRTSAAGTSIAAGTSVIPVGPRGLTGVGIQGPQGAQGPQGNDGPPGSIGPSAQTTLLTSFNQPAVGNDTVGLSVADASMLEVGQSVYVMGGGYYKLKSKVGTVIVLTNVYDEPANVTPGTLVNGSGSTVLFACGYTGRGGYSYLVANFTQPAVSGTIGITVAETTPFVVGVYVYVAGAGYFKVTAVPTATTMTLQNLGSLGNAVGGTLIAAGAKIVAAGPPAQQAVLNADTVAVNTAIDSTYNLVLVDASLGPVTITLPAANNYEGHSFHIKKVDATANAVTIVPTGDLIDGAASQVITTQYDSVSVTSDANDWWIY